MIKSCGCVIFNKGKVLIIKQINGDYGFPKGHIENCETEVDCATRETFEETGINVVVDPKYRFSVSYKVNGGFSKIAVYFIAFPKNDDIVIQEEELLDARWVDVSDVYNILTYDNLKKMWSRVYSTYMEVYNG